jgi:hypothetical protein
MSGTMGAPLGAHNNSNLRVASIRRLQMIRSQRRAFFTMCLAAASMVALAAGTFAQGMSHTSKRFSGSKVNEGTVTHKKDGNKNILELSADFKVPDTPDPHWQVIDSKGQVFLLQRLGVKNGVLGLTGDKVNRQITLPSYIKDVAKVQIYCAWAEAVLGETTFNMVLPTE